MLNKQKTLEILCLLFHSKYFGVLGGLTVTVTSYFKNGQKDIMKTEMNWNVKYKVPNK